MVELTAEIVRELLDCDYETGQLTWRIRKRKWFDSNRDWKTWNRKFMGASALTTEHPGGYKWGRVLYKMHLSHRVIWLHKHGEWPEQIDHINGKGWDNRIENLRSVTHQENMRNQKRPKNNTSGFSGVRWNKSSQKWLGQIKVGGKNHHLGYYENKADAIAARKAAEIEHNFHENHGRKS